MSARNASTSGKLFALALSLSLLGTALPAQDRLKHPGDAKSNVKFARDFLRSLYPDLSGQGNTLTYEFAVKYDEPSLDPGYLTVNVGSGPAFATTGCCLGGSAGGQLGEPKVGSSQSGVPAVSAARSAQAEIVDTEGRLHPKQYLRASFLFDSQNRLTGFSAEGPAIGSSLVGNQMFEFVQKHHDVSDSQIAEQLKKLGVKYGPNDKQEFISNLPLRALSRFLGEVTLLDASFTPFDNARSNISGWPYWTVKLAAKSREGQIDYVLGFDSFKGNLVNITRIDAAHSSR